MKKATDFLKNKIVKGILTLILKRLLAKNPAFFNWLQGSSALIIGVLNVITNNIDGLALSPEATTLTNTILVTIIGVAQAAVDKPEDLNKNITHLTKDRTKGIIK